MNIEFLKLIVENKFVVFDNYEVVELIFKLIENLGVVEWELWDYSYMILSVWIWGWYDCINYSDVEMLELVEKVKCNIKIGFGEVENDGVFLWSYFILFLSDLIDFYCYYFYLGEMEICDCMEFYLIYIKRE